MTGSIAILTLCGLAILPTSAALAGSRAHHARVAQATKPQIQKAGVAFAPGDVLADVGGGQIRHFNSSGTLLDTLDSTTGTNEGDGMCFDSSTNLYATQGFSANTVSKFDSAGNLLNANWGSGYNQSPESCTVDASNDIYVGQPDGTHEVLKFDAAGNPLASYSPATEDRGTDWVDMAADQKTLYYTSEGSSVKRFDVLSNSQLADFATGLPSPCYELRIRPNGEVLVACTSEVVRLSSSGSVLQTYAIPGTSLLFAMNLDPDGTSFWTADYFTGAIYHIDIATGNTLGSFTTTPNSVLGGLIIVGGIVVGQPAVKLQPPTANANVGTTDTVTATITNPGGSISGQTVNFSVSGVNAASGTGTTNASGQATFSYSGASVGADTITATFTNSHGAKATGTATVTWQSSGTCSTQPWPSEVTGYPKLHAHFPQGLYIGQVNGLWAVYGTHKGSNGEVYRGTITTNGTFGDIGQFKFDGRDTVALTEPAANQINFRFINRGYLDGLGFTPMCGTEVSLTISVNGAPASTSQLFLGAGSAHPSSSSLSFTRPS